jgi:hypothetical protein
MSSSSVTTEEVNDRTMRRYATSAMNMLEREGVIPEDNGSYAIKINGGTINDGMVNCVTSNAENTQKEMMVDLKHFTNATVPIKSFDEMTLYVTRDMSEAPGMEATRCTIRFQNTTINVMV